MQIPADKQVHKGRLGTYWIDDEGILISVSTPEQRTLQNTKENVELIKRITNNRKVCVLVYLTRSKRPDKKTREYVKREMGNIYKSMAIVSKGGLGELVMNVLFKLSTPPIPMKTFSNDAEAREWLKQFV